MTNFIVALSRAIILTLLTQLIYWFNLYMATGVIDQTELIFTRDNIFLSLKILAAYFTAYYTIILYFETK